MKPERWQHIQNLYHGALEREPVERSTFLDQACAGDETLRGEVESLLTHHQQAGSFIETPALKEARDLLENQPHSKVGRQIGAYKVLSLLGVGGWEKCTWPKTAGWNARWH